MKKEKYFRDELQHMFIYYAIVPAVVFTLLCGVVFMVALIPVSYTHLTMVGMPSSAVANPRMARRLKNT